MGKTLAMILAGGKGKRMDILCYTRPKPALPFAGGLYVIDFTLSNCHHSCITDIAVLTDYQRSYMANYLRRWHQSNTATDRFNILEPGISSYKGTADAVYQNLDYLQRYDKVLVLAGDHIYKMDYRKMLAFHEQSKADVTVGVVRVPMEQAQRFGLIARDNEGRVTSFAEKPELPQSNLASMGIYIFNRQTLTQRLVADAMQPDSPHDFGYAILPQMVKQDRVFAYEFDGYWQDIGTKEAYYEANMELINTAQSFSLDGKWPVLSETNHWPPFIKSKEGSVTNSIVSRGCVIKGHVENSILSPGVWVDERAIVKNSILMSNVFVGYHSVIDRCVLDQGVNIGKLCYLGFGGRFIEGSSDITVLGEDVTIPHNTVVGCHCRISPHIGPTDLNTSIIPSDTTIWRHPVTNNTMAREEMTVNKS